MTVAIPEPAPTPVMDGLAAQLHNQRAGTIDLTDRQVAYLLGELRQDRVRVHQGNSYLEGWDVRRTLTRIFGFGGWELTTTELKCIREYSVPSGTDKKKFRWWASYRAQVRLTVYAPDGRKIAHFEDGSAGESANQPSHGDCHDMAMKTALTGALKRCAVNLGDQLGLSLYRNGDTEPVVLGSLPHVKDRTTTEVAEGPGVAEEPADMSEVGGTQEAQEEERPADQPPAAVATPAPDPAAPPAPEITPEEWAKKFTAALPDADLDKLGVMQADLSERLKAKWIAVPVARNLMTELNRRRGEAKKAAQAGGAGDAA
ncbi:Rad52/Rad22 family DNA repair protein [Nocardiopsis sp. CT-R113]|uniref:Rad52/Rad22 family DNA repair protein n=1 Tax=Nocardiopsis codii TaxID=3065942 RepID=A0ABU7KD01_9ACTN|nr:Rad52/Rad22 family DNA repair protein [Nocardiopsis sp. CT-R113]MEE2040105.1 Rad52/Rad22 family DNA repair protein [Nocardiopsis sp. CT-R113]